MIGPRLRLLQVIELALRPDQARAVQTFIRASLSETEPAPLAPGPYDDSAFYAAGPQYSRFTPAIPGPPRRSKQAMSPSGPTA